MDPNQTMETSPESVETELNQQTEFEGDEYSPKIGTQTTGEPETQDVGGETVSTDTVQTESVGEPQGATTINPEEYTKLQEQTTALQAQIDHLTKMATFYQTAYNEGLTQRPGQALPQQPGMVNANATPEVPSQLPQGVKMPEEWESPADAANYSRHIAQETVRNTIGQIAQTMSSQMQSMNKWVSQIEEMVIKTTHPDFDEVTNSVMPEMFATDHEGKIWTDPQGQPKVINPGLLQYIRQSPSPRKALYEYGLSKRAPQKIADAKKETTKNLLKAIDTKPKGPTMPKQSSGASGTMTLDWNTPREIADKLL